MPEIVARIIESVSVFVVILCVSRQEAFYNFAMHVKTFYYFLSSHSHAAISIPNKAVRDWLSFGAPFPLHQEFVIFRADDGELTLSERDETSSVVHSIGFGRPVCLATTGLPSLKAKES